MTTEQSIKHLENEHERQHLLAQGYIWNACTNCGGSGVLNGWNDCQTCGGKGGEWSKPGCENEKIC